MGWLKFDVDTPEKPEVLAITAAMGWTDTDLTVGKLLKVWRWFDRHTTDGNARGVTPALLNGACGVPAGFIEAMLLPHVGWMTQAQDGTLSLPNFEHHNGATAKQRALTANRVAKCKSNARGNGAGSAEGSGTVTPGALPREEEEKKDDDDAGASARAGEGAREAAGAPAPAHAWEGDPLDDPTVPKTRGDWAAVFAERDHELDIGNARAHDLMKAWKKAGVTAGELRQAILRAEAKAAGPIGCWSAYVDSVLADQRIAATKAASDARERGGTHSGAQHTQGSAVPTYEETKAKQEPPLTDEQKRINAENARKAKAERDRIAAAKLAAATAPAEGAQA